MLYDLWPHQKTGLDMLRDSFRRGLTRPIFQAACGYGKTVVMAHIVTAALDKGKKILVVAPYTSLINQTAASFIKQDIPQPGIMQADHPWTDPSKRLQIASIQTLMRRKFPEVDLILVDEAHIAYKFFLKYMEETTTPVIGFTATPFTTGLGKYYNNLIQPISMQELIDTNYLSEYVAYAPCEPDMKGVKTVKGDWAENETSERMSTNQITGSITETWMEKGNNEPTICFAVNVAHANHIGTAFDKLEITNVVITAKTPMDEREKIFQQFASREITILINVGTLVAGFDADVRCVIHASPTKSLIKWVQKIGRGLRTADGKEKMILLDHSGTIEKLGFPEDIVIHKLCTGKDVKERKIAEKNERDEKLPKKCPNTECNYIKPVGEHKCSECGFEPRRTEDVEVIEGELKQIKGKATKQDKQDIWNQIKGYQIEQRFKNKILKDGWCNHLYKDLTGVWPRGLRDESSEPGEAIRGFIKHKNIKWAKRNAANKPERPKTASL